MSNNSYYHYSPEICICAAIKLEDGRIIRGHRHSDCIRTMSAWANAGQAIGTRSTQGFVTSENRFVNRQEGAQLMRRICWTSVLTGGPFNADILFSEDLY